LIAKAASTEDRTLVTIGIAVFNAADTVERAVKSALAQTWRPIEIVVVDDFSDDGTQDTLARLVEDHPEIRLLLEDKNRGVAATRNRIIEEAQGEFLAFFDGDNESHPERITCQVERITTYERAFSNGAPVICHTARRQLFSGGSQQVALTMGTRQNAPGPAGWAVAERILIGTPLKDGYGACATCSQMARTSLYRDLGGFDPAFRRSEDTEIAVRLAKAGGHFVGIAEPLVDQFMTRTSDKNLRDERGFTIKLLEKHRDVADRRGLFEFCRSWIEIKQAWLEDRQVDFVRKTMLLACRHPLQTLRRLALAVRNVRLNAAFGRFMRPATNTRHG